MERRKFVKKLSVFTTGTLVLSGSNLYALETDSGTKTLHTSINLTPFSINDKKITLQGNFLDSKTFEPIQTVILKAKIKNNRFLPLSKSIVSRNASYEIQTGFSSNGNKIYEKISVEIKSTGYKPFYGYLYLSTNGCNVHSDFWNYNPDFQIENCPQNEYSETHTLSRFDFHLVKE